MHLLNFTLFILFWEFWLGLNVTVFIFFKHKKFINFQELKIKKMYQHYFNISKQIVQGKQLEVATCKSSLLTSFQ
jgi:hypothetical protein